MEEQLRQMIIKNAMAGGKGIGLLRGDMGICLSLYMLSDHGKYPEAEGLADIMLEKIIKGVNNSLDISFDKGITGIGFAINFLHQSKYLLGDIDDILYDIDTILYKKLCSGKTNLNLEWTNGYLGYMLYLVSRLGNLQHNHNTIIHKTDEYILKQIINILCQKMPMHFNMMSKELYASLSWKFPILFYCLGKTVELGISTEQIKCVLNEWMFFICSTIPHYNINRLALANSLTYLNKQVNSKELDSYVNMLKYSVDVEAVTNEFEYDINCINYGWLYCLFCLSVSIKLFDDKKLKLKKQMIWNTFYQNYKSMLNRTESGELDVTFMSGLSGVAFLYKFFPFMFEGNMDY